MFMIITRTSDVATNLRVNNTHIKRVSKYKYLGTVRNETTNGKNKIMDLYVPVT